VVSALATVWGLLPNRAPSTSTRGIGQLTSLRIDMNKVKKKTANLPPKLTEGEQDLLSHIQDGYQLETNSLGGDPILRRLKDNEVIRPLSANRNTIKALEERGLISPGKGRDPLTIVWRLKKTID
jgi:hypothetical protein